MTKNNLVVLKGRTLPDKFGLSYLPIQELDDLLFKELPCFGTSTTKRLREVDQTKAFFNFPDEGTSTRYSKEELLVFQLHVPRLAAGAMLAKDFYNDKKSADDLMYRANYLYSEGIRFVYVCDIPERLIGYLINLHDENIVLNGFKDINKLNHVMNAYSGSKSYVLHGWDLASSLAKRRAISEAARITLRG